MRRYALALAALIILIAPAKAQPYPYPPYGPAPDPFEWGPAEQELVLPAWPRTRRRVSPQEYDIEARCVLHPMRPECPRPYRRNRWGD